MDKYLVSILMPVYNEQKYISEAIDSVLSQTYSDFELIIIDDGSTDKTAEIIKAYKDTRITFLQPGKIGKVAAFNLAFSNSKGDFICLFAGDDILPKDSLKNRIYKIKEEVKKPAISFCKIKTFSTMKQYDGIVIPKGNKGNLSGGAMMFNRVFSDRSFPIPQQLVNEDMWQVQHALYLKDVVIKHVPIIGSYFRIHSANSSSKQDPFSKKTESMHRRFIVYKIFLDKYHNHLDRKSQSQLIALDKAEFLRYRNRWISIMFIKKISFVQKMRFIMYSNSFFYNIRIKFFSFFTGRGR